MPNFGLTSEGPRTFFLEGELDLATVPLMNTAIGEAVSRGGPITIDVSGVNFMDSTGVGAILQAANNLPSGCIVLHGVHDGVGKVMDLMGVDRAMPELHVIPCLLGPGDPNSVSGRGPHV
jgi:anti-anti-sigma factor